MTVAFAYYLIAFELKYLHGNIYINACVTCVAEIFGKLMAGLMIVKIGLKPLYFVSFFIAAVGTALLIFFPNGSELHMSIFIMITRFGASMAIVGASLGTVLIIPTQLVSTAMGICNAFARTLAMLAPLIAEMAQPTPLVILECFIVLSFFATIPLRYSPKKTVDDEEKVLLTVEEKREKYNLSADDTAPAELSLLMPTIDQAVKRAPKKVMDWDDDSDSEPPAPKTKKVDIGMLNLSETSVHYNLSEGPLSPTQAQRTDF
jgi:MFS family permease